MHIKQLTGKRWVSKGRSSKSKKNLIKIRFRFSRNQPYSMTSVRGIRNSKKLIRSSPKKFRILKPRRILKRSWRLRRQNWMRRLKFLQSSVFNLSKREIWQKSWSKKSYKIVKESRLWRAPCGSSHRVEELILMKVLRAYWGMSSLRWGKIMRNKSQSLRKMFKSWRDRL